MPHIYLDDALYQRLAARAGQLNIPVHQLAADILNSVDLDRSVVSPQSFQSLYQDLRKNVDRFVQEAADGAEFLLREVAGWDTAVPQASYAASHTVTPNGRRAALGRQFLNDVKAGNVPCVTVAMRKDRQGMVKKLDKYGVVIYKVRKGPENILP